MSVLLIAGDMHYGKNHEMVYHSVEKLLNLAETLNAKVVLNGDVFNFWYERKESSPIECNPLVEMLKNYSIKGIEIVVLRGNRDFLMNDDFEKYTGVTLFREDICKDIGPNIWISHGDQFVENRSYKIYRWFIRSELVRKLSKIVPLIALNKVIKVLRKEDRVMNSNLDFKLPSLLNKIPDGFLMVLGHFHKKAFFEDQTKCKDIVFCPAFDESAEVLKVENHKFEFIKVGL